MRCRTTELLKRMNSKKAFFWLIFLLYLFVLSQTWGIRVGLYVSLLFCSFFLLFTPIVSYLSAFVALFSRGNVLVLLQRGARCSWIGLLLLNFLTLAFLPVIYAKTSITMFVHHMFLVPVAGSIPVVVTGCSALLSFLVAEYSLSRWVRICLCVAGALGCSLAFYFFMKGFYFAQFIASLNSTAINY